MAIEVISARSQYEAFIHCIGERPDSHFDEYYEIGRPNVEAVKDLLADKPRVAESLAWVDLSERAEVKVRHDVNPEVRGYDTAPYGVPDYPEETMWGGRMLFAETWLVTDRIGPDLEFTVLSDIVRNNVLSPYAMRWMRTLAASRSHPAFYNQVDHFITGEPHSTSEKWRLLREQQADKID